MAKWRSSSRNCWKIPRGSEVAIYRHSVLLEDLDKIISQLPLEYLDHSAGIANPIYHEMVSLYRKQ